MLDPGGDQVALARVGRRRAEDRQVVGLGAAGGEDDPGGGGVEQGGPLSAGLVDRGPRLFALVVGAGGIAVILAEEGQHRLPYLGGHRGGGIVVEVDPVHMVSIRFREILACSAMSGATVIRLTVRPAAILSSTQSR